MCTYPQHHPSPHGLAWQPLPSSAMHSMPTASRQHASPHTHAPASLHTNASNIPRAACCCAFESSCCCQCKASLAPQQHQPSAPTQLTWLADATTPKQLPASHAWHTQTLDISTMRCKEVRTDCFPSPASFCWSCSCHGECAWHIMSFGDPPEDISWGTARHMTWAPCLLCTSRVGTK